MCLGSIWISPHGVGRPQCCLSRNVIKTEILDSSNMFYLVMIPIARWLSRQWMLHSINMFCLLPKPKFFIVEEEEKKNCFKITQNLLYCSLRYIYKHIGTPKFLVKVLFFFSQKSCISRHFTARPNKSSEANS